MIDHILYIRKWGQKSYDQRIQAIKETFGQLGDIPDQEVMAFYASMAKDPQFECIGTPTVDAVRTQIKDVYLEPMTRCIMEFQEPSAFIIAPFWKKIAFVQQKLDQGML